MSNFERVRKIKEENRKKSDTRREKLAGYFFDLSKLSFAGLIVGLILPLFSDISDVTNWLSVLFGVLLTIIPALLANKSDMETFVVVYALGTVIVGGIYLWTFTKRGKEWLKKL